MCYVIKYCSILVYYSWKVILCNMLIKALIDNQYLPYFVCVYRTCSEGRGIKIFCGGPWLVKEFAFWQNICRNPIQCSFWMQGKWRSYFIFYCTWHQCTLLGETAFLCDKIVFVTFERNHVWYSDQTIFIGSWVYIYYVHVAQVHQSLFVDCIAFSMY